MTGLLHSRTPEPTNRNAEPATLVDVLHWRARSTPDRVAYTYLVDGETTELSLTYGQLDEHARIIAAQLAAFAGERVLLLHHYGLDYITTFFGCLYAGAIAVTAFPPGSSRHLKRLHMIARDSGAVAAATNTRIAEAYGSQLRELLPPTGKVLVIDALEGCAPDDWNPPSLSGSNLAFIQYSSGSTTAPKGVMLSHECLRHNCAALAEACALSESSRGVFWLPLYHDMGLICSVVAPLHVGFPVVLMSPLSFLKRPIRWLRTIARSRATFSAAPNFAFDLCTRKITPEECRDLDLSCWRSVLNGAEPIRSETLERFARLVQPAGFPWDAHRPAYGLAEATLMVTAVRSGRRHETLTATPRSGSMKQYVSCGAVARHHRVVIVDPESRVQLDPGSIGEVWVAGPSVALGYWGRDEETAAVFQAYTADGDGPFLRTGDLGFVENGELFITGRRKDLIIIRGANLFPQDVEWTAEDAHPAIRPTCGAAFDVMVGGEEQLGIVYEVDRSVKANEEMLREIIQRVRQLVTEDHEVTPHVIALVRPGSVPKTSSGKIQRFACREAFLAGSFHILAESWLDADDAQGEATDRSDVGTGDTAEILEYLRQMVATRLGVAVAQIHQDGIVSELGLDSLHANELCNRIQSRFGVELPVSLVLQTRLTELAAQIARHQTEASHETTWKPPLVAIEREGRTGV